MIKKLFCIFLIINFSVILFCQENTSTTNLNSENNSNDKKTEKIFSLEDLSNQLKNNNSELKILNQEVERLKGNFVEEENDITSNLLEVETHISDDYVSETELKIENPYGKKSS